MDLSKVTYNDLFKEKLYLYNDDVNSQSYVFQILVMILGFSLNEALNMIKKIEDEEKGIILESNYFSLLEKKQILEDFNLKVEIE